MVGLFTFATIGVCVLVDLWEILDIRKGHSMVRDDHFDNFMWLILCSNTSGVISRHELVA
jgi:dolichyl-phosphate-mannose--protein O-mannosyl transferase